MTKFFTERVISYKPFYILIGFGIVISFLHIFQDGISFIEFAQQSPFLFTPYQSWIGMGIGSKYKYILFLLLPIIAGMVFSDTYARDVQTGFLKSILSKGKMNAYFVGLYVTNFVVAGITIAVPLLMNLYLAFMTMPNIKPDPVLDLNPLGHGYTLFPDLYYQFPLIHTFFYIFLAFLFAGMYATICLSVSLYVKNRFFIIISAFIVNMFLTVILNFSGKYAWIPSNFLTQHAGQPSVSLYAVGLIFLIGSTASTCIYVLGVRHRVIV